MIAHTLLAALICMTIVLFSLSDVQQEHIITSHYVLLHTVLEGGTHLIIMYALNILHLMGDILKGHHMNL